MHVANLELCKELYVVSGWSDPHAPSHYTDDRDFVCSMYTLGYLLRKLPRVLDTSFKGRISQLRMTASNIYGYGFDYPDTGYNAHSQSPEDAAARLCIELIKQNILQPSVTDKESV